MFLNYLLKVKVKVTHTRNWLKTCYFLTFNVICSQFVVILTLYSIVINIIKCSLNFNCIMPQRLWSRSFKLKLLWSFHENLRIFITHLLGFYTSVFTLCPPVNFLCCAYMTKLLIKKVKVTESKHLTQKHYVSSSLRVFVQNLFLFTMFFNVHMRMFCLSFYMTNFLNCVQSGGQGHRKKVGQNAS